MREVKGSVSARSLSSRRLQALRNRLICRLLYCGGYRAAELAQMRCGPARSATGERGCASAACRRQLSEALRRWRRTAGLKQGDWLLPSACGGPLTAARIRSIASGRAARGRAAGCRREAGEGEASRRELFWQKLRTAAGGRRKEKLDRLLLLLCSHGGLRLSEVTALRLGDFDLEGGRVTVRAGTGVRIVELGPALIEACGILETWSEEDPERLLLPGPSGAGVSRGQAYRRVRQAALRIDAALRPGPRQLRREYAARLLRRGMPASRICARLGLRRKPRFLQRLRTHSGCSPAP